MNFIFDIWDRLMANVPNVIEALLLLLIAFLCAYIVKSLVLKLLHVLKVDQAFDKAKLEDTKKTSFKDFIAKLFYILTFAIFVPGIFEKLGLTGVSEPILAMTNKLMAYLPNIVAAVIVLIIGIIIAKTVKELLIPVFTKLNFDAILKKAGFKESTRVSIADVLANTVYVLILIPVVIAALGSLKIEAISNPATAMLNNILVYMPRVAVAIVILFVGRFIANLACELLEKVLVSVGVDRVTEKMIAESGTKTEKNFSISRICAQIVKVVIIIFFLVEGLNILKLSVLTNIGSSIISYLPYAISSIIIMGLSLLLGNFAENSINKKFEDNKIIALIVKVVIITIGAFITLYQLGIATSLVNSAFIIVIGAFAVAFAIAFGVGGRTFASHMLEKLEKRIDKSQKNSKK